MFQVWLNGLCTIFPFHKEAMLVQASSHTGPLLVLVSTVSFLPGIPCHHTEPASASNSLTLGIGLGKDLTPLSPHPTPCLPTPPLLLAGIPAANSYLSLGPGAKLQPQSLCFGGTVTRAILDVGKCSW